MIVVVSGIPRSGTSLMMQMVAAAGIPLYADGTRPADAFNPDGYFEHDAIKRLGADGSVLDGAEGMAVKVVVPLVRYLPSHHGRYYKVIMMERDPDAVMVSQDRMLRAFGTLPGNGPDPEALRLALAEIHRRTLAALSARADVEILPVDYDALVASPVVQATRLLAFLGSAAGPDTLTRLIRPSGSSGVGQHPYQSH